MAKSKAKVKATHYRCRVELSVISVTKESSIRFGPGFLIRAEDLEPLLAKGGPLEGREDCFEPVKKEQDDGTANRSN